jgi:hypothetical protein
MRRRICLVIKNRAAALVAARLRGIPQGLPSDRLQPADDETSLPTRCASAHILLL